jgi:hypothetical protein
VTPRLQHHHHRRGRLYWEPVQELVLIHRPVWGRHRQPLVKVKERRLKNQRYPSSAQALVMVNHGHHRRHQRAALEPEKDRRHERKPSVKATEKD